METYLSIAEVLDKIRHHPDVKLTNTSHAMLKQLGDKQDLVRKPRVHITKSKTKTNKKHF